MSFRHEVRIRYADCDAQRVVYNSHYLTFVDDAFDTWLRSFDPDFESRGWEVMLKKAEVVWHSSARLADVMVLEVSVQRWGNSSFDVHAVGHVDDHHIFDSTIVYVAVDAHQYRPTPIPDDLRAFLST